MPEINRQPIEALARDNVRDYIRDPNYCPACKSDRLTLVGGIMDYHCFDCGFRFDEIKIPIGISYKTADGQRRICIIGTHMGGWVNAKYAGTSNRTSL